MYTLGIGVVTITVVIFGLLLMPEDTVGNKLVVRLASTSMGMMYHERDYKWKYV